MNDTDVVVSIICCTFNQERYIAQAMDSFLSQRTSFKFEVVVRDDASCDNTQAIVEDFVAHYPDRVVYIREPVNTFSKGIKPFPSALPFARGRYIAICEGDDFWLCRDKLQKQYEILERNKDVDLCFHPAWEYRSDKRSRVICDYSSSEFVLNLSRVIKMRGGGMPTASLFIRKSALQPLPDWFLNDAPVGDSFIQAFGSRNGGAYYIADVMSAYRKYTSGSRTLESATRRYTESELSLKMRGYQLSYAGLDRSLRGVESNAVFEALLDELLHLSVLALMSNQYKILEEALDPLRFNTLGLKPRRLALYVCKKIPFARPFLKVVIKVLLSRNIS